jgi:ubiquitin carboxyl-terminal hydrolase 10
MEQGLALPSREQAVEEQVASEVDEHTHTEEPEDSQASTVAPPSEAEVDTPSTSHPPSEVEAALANHSPTQQAPASKHTRNTTKPAVPLIPIRSAKAPSTTSTTQKSVKSPPATKQEITKSDEAPAAATDAAEETPKASPPKPAPPKSWAELLRAKNAPAAAAAAAPQSAPTNGVITANGPLVPKSNTLVDVLMSFSVDSHKKIPFLEPRGLVNTGNLCYMNSVSILPVSTLYAADHTRFFKFFFSAFHSTTF